MAALSVLFSSLKPSFLFVLMNTAKLGKLGSRSYKNGKKEFICQYCTGYSCLQCDERDYQL